jgi:serine/tyrosine/threonine adenylyltransferase
MIKFDNSYSNLPEAFFSKISPRKAPSPQFIHKNLSLANQLNIDPILLSGEKIVKYFSGNSTLEGSDPIAMVYAGYQFGHFVPQLGDGRAILLGETIDRNGVRQDIQLKGSGRTPYSRGGDGLSPLGPVIREYLVSEALNKLNIQTTRSLAAVSTGDSVYRETELPGAILTRVARSHVRIGTFEYFSAKQDMESVRVLADYCIDRLYPELKDSTSPYLDLLESVMDLQINLISQWLSVGFIHGVMNTDNTSISGETIDFGPCAFMEKFNPNQVFSAIDQQGRYSYSNQPQILHWNLMRLAEALLLLFDTDEKKAVEKAESVFEGYWSKFNSIWSSVMLKKMGISETQEGDVALVHEFMDLMHASKSDFTLSFRLLSHRLSGVPFPVAVDVPLFKTDQIKNWEKKWKDRLTLEKSSEKQQMTLMDSVNPIFIPRNHLIERAIQEATHSKNYSLMKALNTVLEFPFEYQNDSVHFMVPANDENEVLQTFCGT